MRSMLMCLGLLLIVAAPGAAQTVKNPRTVVVTCDSGATPTTLSCEDAKQVTAYEVDFLRSDGTLLRTIVIPAVPPDATNQMALAMNVQPFEFGTYTVAVRAVAGTVKTADSPPSDPWDRSPGTPSKPIVK